MPRRLKKETGMKQIGGDGIKGGGKEGERWKETYREGRGFRQRDREGAQSGMVETRREGGIEGFWNRQRKGEEEVGSEGNGKRREGETQKGTELKGEGTEN
jgi:hypothetical protein